MVVALPPPPKISASACDPTESWKVNYKKDLMRLSQLAAKNDAEWPEAKEAELIKRIDLATSKSDCVTVEADFEALRKQVTRH